MLDGQHPQTPMVVGSSLGKMLAEMAAPEAAEARPAELGRPAPAEGRAPLEGAQGLRSARLR